MKKEGVVIISLVIIITLINFVSAEIKEVECTVDSVCIEKYGQGYYCTGAPNWECSEVSDFLMASCGDSNCDTLEGETKTNCPEDCNPNYQPETDNSGNSVTIALIIGAAVIIGFIILGLLLKKRKRR